MGIGGAIIAGGVISAGGSYLSGQAAKQGAEKAAQAQLDMFRQTQQTLAPFVNTGANALRDAYTLTQRGPTGGGRDYVDLAYQNIPGQMTQAQLEATPGYQFTLAQGLKATQSAAAARGLGVSGPSLKGAGTYATGLADATYKTQFDIAQQRFNDYLNLNTGQQGVLQGQYNRLAGIGTIGANAAAGQATAGTAAAATQGNYLNQAGLDTAAGYTGASNALVNSGNSLLAYNQFQKYLDKSPMTGGYVDNTSTFT